MKRSEERKYKMYTLELGEAEEKSLEVKSAQKPELTEAEENSPEVKTRTEVRAEIG